MSKNKKEIPVVPSIKGYKVFNPDFTCNGFKYAENAEFKFDGEIKICASGFHFCKLAQDCFKYYDFKPENIVCEVIGYGECQTKDDDSKVCTGHIAIGRKLSWHEVLEIANSGSHNTGHSNSGYRNSGDRNSGDSNSGYRNSGAFCVEKNAEVLIFDKPSGILVRDWENHRAVMLMSNLDPTIWVPSSMMTDAEKEAHPKHETTDGYLKTISLKEAWANMWGNLSDKDKAVFTTLPNFDAQKFFQITGIQV